MLITNFKAVVLALHSAFHIQYDVEILLNHPWLCGKKSSEMKQRVPRPFCEESWHCGKRLSDWAQFFDSGSVVMSQGVSSPPLPISCHSQTLLAELRCWSYWVIAGMVHKVAGDIYFVKESHDSKSKKEPKELKDQAGRQVGADWPSRIWFLWALAFPSTLFLLTAPLDMGPWKQSLQIQEQ